jgi:FKBP-type peptidyl-prolyl cis-trans isomerase
MNRHWMVAGALSLALAAGLAAAAETPASPAAPAPAAPAPAAPAPATRPAGEGPTLTSLKDKVSYLVGLSIGKSFRQTEMTDLDEGLLLRGLRDGLADAKSPLTAEEAKAVMTAYQAELMTRLTDRAKEKAEKNKKDGQAFLEANKNKDGVKTTASGLQYEVLKSGTGATPKATDKVSVNYVGTLIDGTKFDSSYDRGEPASFPVGGVIKGWTEALKLMKVGDKWKLYVPSELAYGEGGTGREGPIGPNSVLIFEVELLGIVADSGSARPR